MMEKLQKLLGIRDQFTKQSQPVIQDWVTRVDEIEKIEQMKAKEGWQVLEKKIKEDLHNRIYELVKNDQKILTLLSILTVTSVGDARKRLEEEIDEFLPE